MCNVLLEACTCIYHAHVCNVLLDACTCIYQAHVCNVLLEACTCIYQAHVCNVLLGACTCIYQAHVCTVLLEACTCIYQAHVCNVLDHSLSMHAQNSSCCSELTPFFFLFFCRPTRWCTRPRATAWRSQMTIGRYTWINVTVLPLKSGNGATTSHLTEKSRTGSDPSIHFPITRLNISIPIYHC